MPSGNVGGWFKKPTENIVAIEPVEDQPTGHNFPYRGGEQHGVTPTAPEYNPAEEWAVGHAPDYLPDEDEKQDIQPVPVRIVSESARELRSWSTGSAVADGTVRQVAGKHDRRTRLIIKNLSADKTVYVGTSMTTNNVSGYPLDPDKELTFYHEMEVYAVGADTSVTVNLAVLSEFSVEM